MNQPPQFPGPSDPQQPHQPQQHPQQPGVQHSPPGTGQEWQPAPGTPQQGQQDGKGGPGKGPILVAVGCGLLILVLLLALVGFFGVRALIGDDESGEQTSASEEEAPAEEGTDPEDDPAEQDPAEEATEAEPTEPEPTDEAAPAGEENAVPRGTVVTLQELDHYEGTLDISVGDVQWDATDWVNEQNSHNPKPGDQEKYVMVQAEVTYHGPGEFSSSAFVPVDYVAEDGTPYEEAGVVTPDTMEKLALEDGESGTLHWVFLLPEDTPEGGHFVLVDSLPLDEALDEGQWVEAA